MKKIYLFLIIVIVCSVSLFAKGAGTTAASFLKIDTGARPVGMGGAFCGIADDVNTIQYNPAGLVQIKLKEIGLTHIEWIEKTRSELIGYAHPINESLTLGLMLNYLYTDGLIERDIFGNESGKTFSGNDGVATFAVAVKLLDNISTGLNLKIIRETVKTKNDIAYAADIGFLYTMSKLQLGAVVQNFGTKIKLYENSFSLPLNYKFGMGYEFIKNAKAGVDVNIPIDNKTDIRIGGEYWIANIIALRTGYKFNHDKNTGIGISVGAGFELNNYRIDYSFLPYGDLNYTHMF